MTVCSAHWSENSMNTVSNQDNLFSLPLEVKYSFFLSSQAQGIQKLGTSPPSKELELK